MKFVIQRVSHASVTIDGEIRGEIEKGFYALCRLQKGKQTFLCEGGRTGKSKRII